MKDIIKKIIETNLPEKKEMTIILTTTGRDLPEEYKVPNTEWNDCLSQINTSLIADELLKITKCDCCDEKDEHIFPDDRSTTRISRPCGGCGKHQTIAGALLKSKEWEKWYKYASENMLFDVDETLTVDAMSDEHWNSFIKFLNDEVLKVVKLEIEKDLSHDANHFCKKYGEQFKECAMCYFERKLSSEHLSPNKENKNNG